jgi:steroid delta-isomerase-like uncharacterized protein
VSEVAGDISKLRPIYAKDFAPEYVCHSPRSRDLNWEQNMQIVISLVSAFPDLSFSIDDIVGEGDKVAIRYTQKGTHKGTFMGIPATGKQIVEHGMEMHRIVGGKVVETWMFPAGTWMTQLGVVPSSTKK